MRLEIHLYLGAVVEYVSPRQVSELVETIHGRAVIGWVMPVQAGMVVELVLERLGRRKGLAGSFGCLGEYLVVETGIDLALGSATGVGEQSERVLPVAEVEEHAAEVVVKLVFVVH